MYRYKSIHSPLLKPHQGQVRGRSTSISIASTDSRHRNQRHRGRDTLATERSRGARRLLGDRLSLGDGHDVGRYDPGTASHGQGHRVLGHDLGRRVSAGQDGASTHGYVGGGNYGRSRGGWGLYRCRCGHRRGQDLAAKGYGDDSLDGNLGADGLGLVDHGAAGVTGHNRRAGDGQDRR